MANLKASKQNLFDEFEIKGEWWFPESPEDKIAGTLTYSKEDIKLELMGSWNKENSLLSAFEFKSLDIILGTSVNDEMFTLINIFPTNQTASFGGYSTVNYNIESFIVGGHFKQKNEMLFSACTIFPTYLTEWLNRRPFTVNQQPDSTRLSSEFTQPKIFEYNISTIEATVREESNLEVKDSDFNQRIQMYHSSGISILPKDLQDIEWFHERSSQLTNLISTLIGKGIYFERISFKGSPVEEVTPFGKRIIKQQKYTYFKKQHDIRLKEKFNDRDIIVHFSEVEDNFENLLNNWFGKYKELKVIHNLYFGILYNIINIDTTFLSSVQMLEIYHRTRFTGKIFEEEFFKMEKNKLKGLSKRNVDKSFHNRVMQLLGHANDFTLGNRLNEIIDSFSKETKESLIGTSDDIKVFIKQLVDTRNFLAHYDENRKPYLIKGIDERYYAIKRLEAIVTLLLLKEAGLEEGKVLEKVKNSMHYSYNLKKAKELLNNIES